MSRYIDTANIYMGADEILQYVKDNIGECVFDTVVLDLSEGLEITISIENGEAALTAYVMNEPDNELEITSYTTQAEIDDFYDLYLTYEYESEGINPLMQMQMDDREQELGDTIVDMLTIFYPDIEKHKNFVEITEELTDLVCEYLYRKHDISVYRPMMLDDGTKTGFYADHPYEMIDFDG